MTVFHPQYLALGDFLGTAKALRVFGFTRQKLMRPARLAIMMFLADEIPGPYQTAKG